MCVHTANCRLAKIAAQPDASGCEGRLEFQGFVEAALHLFICTFVIITRFCLIYLNETFFQ